MQISKKNGRAFQLGKFLFNKKNKTKKKLNHNAALRFDFGSTKMCKNDEKDVKSLHLT